MGIGGRDRGPSGYRPPRSGGGEGGEYETRRRGKTKEHNEEQEGGPRRKKCEEEFSISKSSYGVDREGEAGGTGRDRYVSA